MTFRRHDQEGPRFTLSVRLDNDAFGEDEDSRRAELCRILCRVVEDLCDDGYEGKVKDSNGSSVGRWEVTP